jgi:fructose-1-phosphate kinase PfkB-like protein
VHDPTTGQQTEINERGPAVTEREIELFRDKLMYLTVGAGDAFLAGYVAARYAGAGPAECLRQGVACGAESTQRLGAGLVDPGTVGRLVSEIQVERVTAPAEVS